MISKYWWKLDFILYSLHSFYLEKFLYVSKRPVIATQPFEINCFAITTEGFKQSEYQRTGFSNINLSVIMTTILLARPLKAKWFQMHRKHCFLLNSKSFESILIGDSLIAGLHHYYKIWNNLFKPIDALNCGIGWNKVQNVLWRVQNLPISSSLKNGVILCGSSNLQQDSPEDIVDGIVEIEYCLKKTTPSH